ncbi:histidinol-phosphate transaminase [Parvularcula sp. LCG005]|uniref:pyridoxal phosphate-dependent aminotransferase n=1 Tax=Parvularcula sp. LCG005 TaxID=3078805 RepID=UPI002942DCAC|nr:histidinol-phosphate transaminase [Parvularcula sp. LCG005]WOI53331.1 histidinol-phosphate transaminase [Parvularcula sp. LCG005]
MTFDLSRRLLLGGALSGASLAASGIGAGAFAREFETPPKKKSVYGPDPKDAHLIFNENPYGPSPKALKALAEAAGQGCYYQGKSIGYLTDMIAERHGVAPEQVVIGSGSYELLTVMGLLYGQKGNILGPDLYWDTTAKYIEAHGLTTLKRSPMTAALEIDLDAMLPLVTDDVSHVQLVNPNNPTGHVLDPAALRAFVLAASKKANVLVDEAYIEIADDPEAISMMDLVREGHDVIVCRTFSKIYGMAGLRIGYAIGQPEAIAAIQNSLITSPNVAGIAAAIASYDDNEFLGFSKSKIQTAREMIMEGTKAAGLKPLPSQTSFVFVDTGMDANVFRDRMREKGVLIRGKYGDFHNYSRVSCGYLEDVKRYVAALPYALEG